MNTMHSTYILALTLLALTLLRDHGQIPQAKAGQEASAHVLPSVLIQPITNAGGVTVKDPRGRLLPVSLTELLRMALNDKLVGRAHLVTGSSAQFVLKTEV